MVFNLRFQPFAWKHCPFARDIEQVHVEHWSDFVRENLFGFGRREARREQRLNCAFMEQAVIGIEKQIRERVPNRASARDLLRRKTHTSKP